MNERDRQGRLPCNFCKNKDCIDGMTGACVWSGGRPFYCQNIHCIHICYDPKVKKFMCSRCLEFHCHAATLLMGDE